MATRDINKVIVHCSYSEWGDAKVIDTWHKERRWRGIGYHFVVLNGHRWASSRYNPEHDGLVERGRPDYMTGAHCRGHNHDSIGICVIGVRRFTEPQLLKTLPFLLGNILWEHKLGPESIFGHRDFATSKTCPNFDIERMRRLVRMIETGGWYGGYQISSVSGLL